MSYASILVNESVSESESSGRPKFESSERPELYLIKSENIITESNENVNSNINDDFTIINSTKSEINIINSFPKIETPKRNDNKENVINSSASITDSPFHSVVSGNLGSLINYTQSQSTIPLNLLIKLESMANKLFNDALEIEINNTNRNAYINWKTEITTLVNRFMNECKITDLKNSKQEFKKVKHEPVPIKHEPVPIKQTHVPIKSPFVPIKQDVEYKMKLSNNTANKNTKLNENETNLLNEYIETYKNGIISFLKDNKDENGNNELYISNILNNINTIKDGYYNFIINEPEWIEEVKSKKINDAYSVYDFFVVNNEFHTLFRKSLSDAINKDSDFKLLSAKDTIFIGFSTYKDNKTDMDVIRLKFSKYGLSNKK
jgi:hypothetical protein